MEDFILEIEGLTKHYKDFTLNQLKLQMPYGCILGLIGENGAGKSTTIKAILGLIHKDGGMIRLFGKDIDSDGEEVKEHIGIVLGELNLPETFNSIEICKMMKGIYKNWNSETYYEYLRRFKIEKKKKIKDYSRGMKMKAALAIALSHEAKLLILDEPTSGLDPVVRDSVLDILREFVMVEERSVLISSHIISDLEKVADYVALLHDGNLALYGEKDMILEEYRILRGSSENIRKMGAEHAATIIGIREHSFGSEALVKDMSKNAEQYGLLAEAAGLENIMIYMVKGGGR